MDLSFRFHIFNFNRNLIIPKQWVRWGIILATVLLSTIVAYWGSMRILEILLVLIAGFGVFLVLIRQPNWGFILIFLGGMFIPFTGPSGINAAVLVVALLLGIWIMDMVAVKRRVQFVRSRALLPVIVFLAISIIAFGMGQIPWFTFASQAPITAQAGGFAIFVLSISALLLSSHLIKEIRWLEIIVWTFIALGAIYVLGRAIRFPYIDRIYQNGFAAGSMFWTWLIALSLSQVIFNKQLKPRIRGLLVGIAVVTFYVAFIQANDWKSGWVPPLVATAALIGMKYKRLTILAIPFAVLVGVYLATDLVASDEYSWGTRIDAWLIVLEISRVSPILGMGFSNYYWYTPLFPIRGWRVSFNSHSQYVDLIAQVGILGLLCFLWIFFEIGRLSWDLTKKLPDGFAFAYSHGVLAGIAGTLMAAFLVDWVLPFVYNIGFTGFRASILPWIFFGGVISIEQIYFRNSESSLKVRSQ
jgi:hypothetical protein